MYGYGEDATAECGCTVEVFLDTDYGCCDEYCTPSTYVDKVIIRSTCEQHTLLDIVPVTGVE